VELYDVDGTKAIVSIFPDISFNQIVVTINLISGTGVTPSGVDPGMDTLEIRNEDTPQFPTDYLDFLIE
jgi:hypothetical protein